MQALAAINAAGIRALERGPSREQGRTPVSGWTPAVLPELINARLALMGIPTGGRPGDYDRAAVLWYQAAQVWPALVPDGLWGGATEGHFNWTITLQGALVRIGGQVPRDGNFTSHVRFTVVNAQRVLGLVPDGVPGPITCARLGIRRHP